MAAGKYNIICDQGANYIDNIYYKDNDDNAIDMTGYSATLRISDSFGGTVIDTHTSSDNLSVIGFLGLINVNIPAATTTGYTAGQYVYDLEVVDTLSVVTKLIRGDFIVRAEA